MMKTYVLKHKSGKYFNHTGKRSGCGAGISKNPMYYSLDTIKYYVRRGMSASYYFLSNKLDEFEIEAYTQQEQTCDFEVKNPDKTNIYCRKQVLERIKAYMGTKKNIRLMPDGKGFKITMECYTPVKTSLRLRTMMKRIEADLIMEKLRGE